MLLAINTYSCTRRRRTYEYELVPPHQLHPTAGAASGGGRPATSHKSNTTLLSAQKNHGGTTAALTPTDLIEPRSTALSMAHTVGDAVRPASVAERTLVECPAVVAAVRAPGRHRRRSPSSARNMTAVAASVRQPSRTTRCSPLVPAAARRHRHGIPRRPALIDERGGVLIVVECPAVHGRQVGIVGSNVTAVAASVRQPSRTTRCPPLVPAAARRHRHDILGPALTPGPWARRGRPAQLTRTMACVPWPVGSGAHVVLPVGGRHVTLLLDRDDIILPCGLGCCFLRLLFLPVGVGHSCPSLTAVTMLLVLFCPGKRIFHECSTQKGLSSSGEFSKPQNVIKTKNGRVTAVYPACTLRV